MSARCWRPRARISVGSRLAKAIRRAPTSLETIDTPGPWQKGNFGWSLATREKIDDATQLDRELVLGKKPMTGRGLFGLVVFVAFAPNCLAHYLWVVIDRHGDGRVANIYFEESPHPGDGSYLEHFLGKEKTWIRTLADPDPDPLNAKEAKQGEQPMDEYRVPGRGPVQCRCVWKIRCLPVPIREGVASLLCEKSSSPFA